MKKYLLVFLMLFVFQVGYSQTKLKNKSDSLSYALGISISESFIKQGLNKSINLDLLIIAIEDLFKNNTSNVLSKEDIRNIFASLENEMQKQTKSENVDLLNKNKEFEKNDISKEQQTKAKENAFLTKNKTNPKVKVTASGLQYEVLTEGKGKKPLSTSTVKVHYTGKLTDGKVFDSSVERGKPIEFPLKSVIKGWAEGVQLMSEGSKYKLTIPSDLAYGEDGAGEMIGPNEVLVFEIELISIINLSEKFQSGDCIDNYSWKGMITIKTIKGFWIKITEKDRSSSYKIGDELFLKWEDLSNMDYKFCGE